MRRSFKLATIFNIPVDINYTWFVILALVIFTLARGYFPSVNPELPSAVHWVMAVFAAILLFASLLAHELSHSVIARRNNLPIHGITLFVFGGVAHLGKEPPTPAVEFKMAVAGPAMSFFLAILFFALTQALYYLGIPAYLLSIFNYLFIVNLMVGIFNLIPGFPLDGGRILRAAIWQATNNLRKATGISAAFGKGFAFLLMALGFLNLFSGSVISGIWFIFIGFFLQEAAEVSYRQVVMKKILSGVRVESLMTKDVVTVPQNITLDKLLDEYFFRFRFATFPVVEDDTLVGLITLHDIKEIDREKWPQVPVREVMIPISEPLIIDRKSEALDALGKMASGGVGRLLVVEDSKLIGILSQRDIMRLFEFKSQVEGD
jgi:Zn-dependent protease/CBS domain-containing protein